MISPVYIVILTLFGLNNVHGIENEETKTVIVPIEQKENVEESEPIYTLFDMPNFDGEQVYKDVSEKMAGVVEQFSSKVPKELPSLSLKSPNVRTTLTNMYKYLPEINIDTEPLTNMYNSLPDIDLNAAYDTMTSINYEPVTSAASDIVAILPTVAVLGFYGLTLYFIVSLVFRAAGFAIATKMNTLRLASEVMMQAPEFVSRMMAGDSNDSSVAKLIDSGFQNDETSRSDGPGNIGLMNLILGAQKVSEAIDKYNNLNQA